MATAISMMDDSKKILLVWRKFTVKNISFEVAKSFKRVLLLNQYVCKHINTIDKFLLIIPRADLFKLLNDPVYRFPQVEVIYVYYDNHKSFEFEQNYFRIRCNKLRFCHERDLIRELEKPKIDNAVHPSRPIDRTAINDFASSVTQRVSAKRPTTTSRNSPAQQQFTFGSSHGFHVKNIEQIDSRFTCPACKLVIREPCQLSCGHRICKTCLNIENDKMNCLTCPEVSSSQNIQIDKDFRKEIEQLLISCALCDWTETLKLYQEHIEQNHQEHLNIIEVYQTNTMHMLSNNNQHQNPLSQIQSAVTILTNNIDMLTNDQERIHDELCCNESLLRIVSEELSSLKFSLEDNVSTANAMSINNDLFQQELWSLRQEIEDRMSASFDGTFLWKINSVEEKIGNAQSGGQRSIYSPPFYSSPTGYKMCMKLYLNGDNDVRGEYLSLFFVLMRGDFDAILQWPFEYKITFSLIDQSTLDKNTQHNMSNCFWPDLTLRCFQRPICGMNEGYGIKKCFPIERLKTHRNLYIQDNVMFIKCETNFMDIRPAYLATSGTGARPNDEDPVNMTGENTVNIS